MRYTFSRFAFDPDRLELREEGEIVHAEPQILSLLGLLLAHAGETVTKETIKKSRRVVIAYSQGAKMGIGGHILAGKVNKLVSYLRGIQGLEKLNMEIPTMAHFFRGLY